MFKGMHKLTLAVGAAAALFVIPISAFSQSIQIQIGPGGVRIDDGRGGAANARKCGVPGAGRRKLLQIPGDLPKTSSEGCVRRIEANSPC